MALIDASKDLPVTKELALEHGLTEEEYAKILDIQGRTPTFTELGIFTLMWSEHCSYKSSKIHLGKFPTTGPQVIQGPGENAGIVDIGDGWCAVFKMESHNHPSFVEPYQGAATGVGGIMRDVFTMGARPVANLNSLRFGSPDHPKVPYLVSGVVSGIGGYGNCMGVPTVGGEVFFDESYNGNNLVNAFTLGIVHKDKIFLGYASGVGNPVIYAGSKTGRDGIHGASLLASAEFDETSEQKKPTVQVGDPFAEKLLLEACLEIMATDALVGIQDMGAAGFTSSSVEMASRAGSGIRLDLDDVPCRADNMTPYEIMLSESQERMLIVAKKGREKEVLDVFAKWDLDCVVVGEVTDSGHLIINKKGKTVADIPIDKLCEAAPVYDRPTKRPAYLDKVQAADFTSLPQPKDYGEVLKKLLASPNIASKHWIFRQYDSMVRTNTVVGPGSDAAVIRVKENGVALAISTDCNARFCYLDPEEGGKIAVAEAARNVVCAGAKPLAVTDCLNFGSPENPEAMWQFVKAVEGLAEACRVFETPVIGGNVSFYNETSGKPIDPTPTIGMVGLMSSPEKHITRWFKNEGDVIYLLGETHDELGGSEYLFQIHGKKEGRPPKIDLALEKKIHAACLEAMDEGIIKSAHDCSEGGLAVTLSESCFHPENPLGAVIDISQSHRRGVHTPQGRAASGDTAYCSGRGGQSAAVLHTPQKSAASGDTAYCSGRGEQEAACDIRPDSLLFGESQSRIVVSINPQDAATLEQLANSHCIPFQKLGTVGGSKLTLSASGKSLLSEPVASLQSEWMEGFERAVFG